MKPENCTSTIGRPREFDVDLALDQALQVFRRKGYAGASLTDLTQAMGINRPSLYAAFGCKEQLFRKALDRYAEGPMSYMKEALSLPTAREAVEALLHWYADSLTDPCKPTGCLTVQGALACSDANDSIRTELASRRLAGEAALRERLQQAQAEGELSSDVDCGSLARYFAAVSQGMAVQATSETSREQLHAIADTAMIAWPTQ